MGAPRTNRNQIPAPERLAEKCQLLSLFFNLYDQSHDLFAIEMDLRPAVLQVRCSK